MKKLLLGMMLSALVSSVASAQVIWVRTTMAGKPTCEAGIRGRIFEISDATTESDCSIGGATGNSRKMALCWCVWTAGTSAYEWQAIARGTAGATTPGGSDTQVQFNDGSAFGGDAGLTFNKTTNVLTATGGFIGAVTGNASTATALAANGANCSAGSYPLGVDASGAAESCTAAATGTIGGSTGATDKALLIANGTGGATVQASANLSQDSSNNLIIGDSSGARELWFSTVATAPLMRRNGTSIRMIGNTGSEIVLQVGAIAMQDATTASTVENVRVSNNRTVCWSDGVDFAQCIAKGAAAGLRITDGSTGIGSLQLSRPLEANTAVSGAPNVLDVVESAGVLTNEGATAENYHTLPGAAAGVQYTFVVVDTDGLRVTAAAGDVIHIAATASSSGGECHSTTIGDAITLTAVNATDWFAVGLVGAGWTCS